MSLLGGCDSPVGYGSGGTTQPITSGTRLLFDTAAVADNAFTSGIDTIAPDGSNFQHVVNDDAAVFPHFSLDGRKLAYETGSGISSLIIANADGFNGVAFSTNNEFPVFRPDGKAVAYVANSDLYTQNIDGSQSRKILAPPTGYSLSRPVYTPDGSHILYEQDPNPATTNTPRVYSVNADGSNPRLVVSGSSATPAVSPDGKRLAYVDAATFGSAQDLFITNLDGTGQPTLLLHTSATLPVFSPDGTRIAYLKRLDTSIALNGSPTYEIHIINVDGTGDIRVGTQLAVATNTLDWR